MEVRKCSVCLLVGKPAPDWNGTAVFKGDFQELKLSDFKGKEVTLLLGYLTQSVTVVSLLQEST